MKKLLILLILSLIPISLSAKTFEFSYGDYFNDIGQEVMELLRSLNAEGTTIVMVTHSPAHADYARRTVNLFDGHVVTDKLRAA